jgi:methyl-accepting chemotaxis protein
MNSPTNSSNPNDPKKKLRLNYFSLAFQLRYGIWLATIGAFCFFLMGGLIHLSIHHAIQSSPQSDAVKQIAAELLSPRAMFLGYDVLLPAGILTVFLFAIGIVGTHRIAGPLFAMKRHMNRVRKGRVRSPIRLRRGDELLDVASSLNAMLETSWEFESELDSFLAEVQANLEMGRREQAIAKLADFRARLHAKMAPPPMEKTPSSFPKAA